jgi:glutathione S-transferase
MACLAPIARWDTLYPLGGDVAQTPLIIGNRNCSSWSLCGWITLNATGIDEGITRITAIWEKCLNDHGQGGDLLFDRFTIADAVVAPLVSRFRTYGVPPGGEAGLYMDALWSLPAMVDRANAAHAETSIVKRYDR